MIGSTVRVRELGGHRAGRRAEQGPGRRHGHRRPHLPPSPPAPATPRPAKGQTPAFGEFLDHWYPIQVKQQDRVGRPDVDSFEAAMLRADRTKGFFVAFAYSDDALREIDAFFRRSGKVIVALTVREILDEQLAKKLA